MSDRDFQWKDPQDLPEEVQNQYYQNDEVLEQHRKRLVGGRILIAYFVVLVAVMVASALIMFAVYPNFALIPGYLERTDPTFVTVLDQENVDYPYAVTVTGTVTNTGEDTVPYLEVYLDIYDENEDLIGTYVVTTENILSGDTWNYEETIQMNFEPMSVVVSSVIVNIPPRVSVIINLSQVLITLILFVFIDKMGFITDWQRTKKSFGTFLVQVTTGIIAVLAVLYLSSYVLQLLGVTTTSENEMTIMSMFTADPVQLVLLFLMLVVITPIVEEMVFRKALFIIIEPRLGSILAIVLSGAVFGLMHVLAGQDFIQAIPYVAMGMTLGFIYHNSKKNIYVTITVHALNNLIPYVIYLLAAYGISIY